MTDRHELSGVGMVQRIARKEVTEMMRDGRFRIAVAVLALLLIASVAAGWRHRADVAARQAAAQVAERGRWLAQPDRDPHSAAHFGAMVFKTPSPLGVLEPGIDPWVGISVFLTAHRQHSPRHVPAEDATALQRFGELTVATTLTALVPLLIVILGGGAFAAERQQGTLRQLLSLGVPPWTLVVGKAMGIAAVVAVGLIPGALLAVAAVALQTGVTSADLVRAGAAGICYVVYLGTILAGTLAVSARAPSPRAALVPLLLFWLVNGLVAPRVGADLADMRYPIPPASSTAPASRASPAVERTDPAVARAEFTRQLLDQYGVDSVAELPVNPAGLWLQTREDRSNRAIDAAEARLDGRYTAQERLLARLGAVAPMLAIESLSMAFAGTDAIHQRAFLDSAESYRRLLVRTLNETLAVHPMRDGTPYRAGRDVWEQLPPFTYSRPSVRWVLRYQREALTVLIVWAGVAAVGLAYAGHRLRLAA